MTPTPEQIAAARNALDGFCNEYDCHEGDTLSDGLDALEREPEWSQRITDLHLAAVLMHTENEQYKAREARVRAWRDRWRVSLDGYPAGYQAMMDFDAAEKERP